MQYSCVAKKRLGVRTGANANALGGKKTLIGTQNILPISSRANNCKELVIRRLGIRGRRCPLGGGSAQCSPTIKQNQNDIS